MQIKKPRIGNLKLNSPVVLAPMAGISSLPFRRIMKSFGASLVFTEMVSANGLIRDGKKTHRLLATHETEAPLGIQLFGDDPTVMAAAAGMVANLGALLDINMGCPVKKVIRSGAGSALLREPKRVHAILTAVRSVYTGPLTIKIRSGWEQSTQNFLEIGRIAEDAGADGVTLHARSRCQGFSGQADWDQIGRLKAALQIPVFGSGDIFSSDDGLKMLQQTGCDAIMIGRGGYGNPWLIQQILNRLDGLPAPGPTTKEIRQTALTHLQLHETQFGSRKTLLEMRKHLCWYARGLTGASHFRSAVQQAESLDQVRNLVDRYFHQAEAV